MEITYSFDQDEIMMAIANVLGNETLREDFKRFDAEIDKVKKKFGMGEDEAIAYVASYWVMPEVE